VFDEVYTQTFKKIKNVKRKQQMTTLFSTLRYKLILGIFTSLFLLTKTQAQGVSFDLGVSLGAVAIEGDYVKTGVFTANMGPKVHATLYMNFFRRNANWYDRSDFLSERIRVKADLSYFQSNLKHRGGPETENSSASAQLLKDMTGKSSIINFGLGVDYYFLRISGFEKFETNFSPYISLGGSVGLSKASVTSTSGNFLSIYDNQIYTDREILPSFVFGGGTRIKINYRSDFIADLNWQYFFSDKLDGIVPTIASNDRNDWIYSLTIGYVYYLGSR